MNHEKNSKVEETSFSKQIPKTIYEQGCAIAFVIGIGCTCLLMLTATLAGFIWLINSIS